MSGAWTPYPYPDRPRFDGAGGPEWPLSLGSMQALPQVIETEKPYPIKAVIFYRTNPVRSGAHSARWQAALAKLDLLVAIDIRMSETALLAHYVLPESHFLERDDAISVAGDTISIRQPVVRPLHDTRPGYEIVRALAEATGVGEYFQFSMRDYNNKMLEPHGWTVDQLNELGVVRVAATPFDYTKLPTASGKVELVNEAVARAGGTRGVSWVPPRTEPEGDRLRLLHGHVPVHTQTYTQNNPQLHALMPENELWIHPEAARARGIRTGDLVEVANEYGRERLRARVTPGIRPDCVWMAHGFGCGVPQQRLAYGKGANDSALYPILMTPVAGALGQGEATVTVRRVGA